MTSFGKVFGPFVVLLSVLVRYGAAQDGFLRRNPGIDVKTIGEMGGTDALRYEGNQAILPPYLSGRSLVNLWLGKRYLTCDSGYGLCTNNICCPLDNKCCPNACCAPGWNCCDPGTCYPVGGDCCADGNICQPGNICVLVNGRSGCCTDLSCTAYVSNGATIALTITRAPVAPPTTPPPVLLSTPPPSIQPPVSIYYYYTITWYYLSWYYSYHYEASTSITTVTSTTITQRTTISIYETDSASAQASFSAISATLYLPTPSAATVIPTLPSPIPSSTPPSTTFAVQSTSPPTTGSTRTTTVEQAPPSTAGGSSASIAPSSTAGGSNISIVPASGARSVTTMFNLGPGFAGSGAITSFFWLIVAPGLLIIWL